MMKVRLSIFLMRSIRFEKSKGGFSDTESNKAFQRLKKHIDEQHKDTAKKQKETKELLVSFALYIEGKKLPEHLAAQRNFLRTRYDKAAESSVKDARRFVSSLADIAEFRRYYWTSEGIEKLALFHTSEHVPQVQLFMSFLKDMQTKLALPILARYWSHDFKDQDATDFLNALKAVTAFLVLRRAASGGTAGIDSDFRAIMAPKNGSTKKFGLCVGIGTKNQRLSNDELKAALRKLLANSKFKITQKDKWVDQVIDNPLYQQAKTLVRFMLLTAAHQAVPSGEKPGCWTKKGVKVSAHINNFLTYETWKGELYETVEHVAPDSEPARGWDHDIYSWKRKKVFYLALTEETAEQQQQRIDEAAALGMNWNCDVIEARARNIAELTWEHLWPWLN